MKYTRLDTHKLSDGRHLDLEKVGYDYSVFISPCPSDPTSSSEIIRNLNKAQAYQLYQDKLRNEIEQLKEQFAKALPYAGLYGPVDVEVDEIEETRDRAQQFIDACREYTRVDVEDCDGIKITVIRNSQRFKGEQRTDVYIWEVDENLNLVYAS